MKSGLDSESIVFVLDAMRPAMYSPEALLQAENSYVSRMRRYFKEQAGSRGYEVLDMQPAFMRGHRLDGSRFEFPADGHWNEPGHKLVAEEMEKSAVFARVFHRAAPVMAPHLRQRGSPNQGSPFLRPAAGNGPQE